MGWISGLKKIKMILERMRGIKKLSLCFHLMLVPVLKPRYYNLNIYCLHIIWKLIKNCTFKVALITTTFWVKSYAGSPHLPTAIGTSNSIAKQHSYKVKHHMTTLGLQNQFWLGLSKSPVVVKHITWLQLVTFCHLPHLLCLLETGTHTQTHTQSEIMCTKLNRTYFWVKYFWKCFLMSVLLDHLV